MDSKFQNSDSDYNFHSAQLSIVDVKQSLIWKINMINKATSNVASFWEALPLPICKCISISLCCDTAACTVTTLLILERCCSWYKCNLMYQLMFTKRFSLCQKLFQNLSISIHLLLQFPPTLSNFLFIYISFFPFPYVLIKTEAIDLIVKLVDEVLGSRQHDQNNQYIKGTYE